MDSVTTDESFKTFTMFGILPGVQGAALHPLHFIHVQKQQTSTYACQRFVYARATREILEKSVGKRTLRNVCLHAHLPDKFTTVRTGQGTVRSSRGNRSQSFTILEPLPHDPITRRSASRSQSGQQLSPTLPAHNRRVSRKS